MPAGMLNTYIALVATMVFRGLSFVATKVDGSVKVALESISTFTLVFVRFFVAALTQVPISRAAVFVNGIPVVTAIGAWVLLDETLTGIQIGGGVLVLAAVFITNLSPGAFRKKQRRPSSCPVFVPHLCDYPAAPQTVSGITAPGVVQYRLQVCLLIVNGMLVEIRIDLPPAAEVVNHEPVG